MNDFLTMALWAMAATALIMMPYAFGMLITFILDDLRREYRIWRANRHR